MILALTIMLKFVKIEYPLKQGLKRSITSTRTSDSYYVKIEYPLK